MVGAVPCVPTFIGQSKIPESVVLFASFIKSYKTTRAFETVFFCGFSHRTAKYRLRMQIINRSIMPSLSKSGWRMNATKCGSRSFFYRLTHRNCAESGRISELRFEGGCAFKASGQRRQSTGEEGTLAHKDFAAITGSGTKILQASQDRLCRMIGNRFNCRVNKPFLLHVYGTAVN